MAIKGSLREAGLADVCQLLSMGRKTGCLSVTDRARFGQIFFKKGRVTFATMVNRRDRLGDMLVRQGKITHQQLMSAVDAQADRSGQRLGEIMVEQGLIDQDVLTETIQQQIEEAVYDLFTWDQGTFLFDPDKTPDDHEILISMNPESLLLESARRVDEWSVIEKKIPSVDLIFTVNRDRMKGIKAELTAAQRRLVELMDGERTVADLADGAGLGEFETGKALYGLIQAGFAQRTGRRSAGAVASVQTEEARNLGVAFFETGMLKDADRAFRRVLETEPGDYLSRHYRALVAIRQEDFELAVRRLTALLESGEPRVGTTLNLAYALRRQGRYDDALQALERARDLAPDDPRTFLAEGVTRVLAGDAQGASDALQAYRKRLDPDTLPPPTYYYYAGLAAALEGRMDAADAQVEEGLGAHPSSNPLQLLAGNLSERRGRMDLAAQYYGQATEGQGLAQAHRNLGDLMQRRGVRRQALDHYARAAEIDPELGDELYTRLAELHYAEGQRQEAVRCWHRALELNPENEVARNRLAVISRAQR